MNIAPWVEKYRPNKFDDIVLEPTNKQLLKNIIKNIPASIIAPNVISITSIISAIILWQQLAPLSCLERCRKLEKTRQVKTKVTTQEILNIISKT